MKAKKTIMVMGGSLGAKAINETVRESLTTLLKNYNIIHICGKDNIDATHNSKHGYYQFEFISKELPDFLAITDFVVSRSGATSIFEFLILNKPMILIPLPSSSSRGDQILNSNYFEKKGFAKVLHQENLNSKTLIQTIDYVNVHLDEYKDNQKKYDYANSNKKIIDIILKTIK